jgi:hypothetical protein
MRTLGELLVLYGIAFLLAVLVFTLVGSSWPILVAVIGATVGAGLILASRGES